MRFSSPEGMALPAEYDLAYDTGFVFEEVGWALFFDVFCVGGVRSTVPCMHGL